MKHLIKAIKEDKALDWPLCSMVALCIAVWKIEGDMVFGWSAIGLMLLGIASVVAHAILNWRHDVWKRKRGLE